MGRWKLGVSTYMDPINIDGDVSDVHRILVPSELHLQQPLETPTHEGGVGEPGGHCGIRGMNM